MIQVRNNIFETNSSSSHSLIITRAGRPMLTAEECIQSLWFDYDQTTGVYDPDPDEEIFCFNRYPFKVLDSFEKKLMFLYANAPVRDRGRSKDGYTIWEHEYYKISNVVKKIIPGFKRVKFHYARPSCEAYNVLDTIKANMTLVEFLINPNVLVICDGDEYQVWSGMKSVNMIATKNFKEIKFPGG